MDERVRILQVSLFQKVSPPFEEGVAATQDSQGIAKTDCGRGG
jgi:hypothetical protein